MVRPGHTIENKGKARTGQSKKSQGDIISPIWGKAPTVPIETKICMAGNLADIFIDYNFTGGRISHFPIDFLHGLYDCAACDFECPSK